jgi:Rrf2 family transcriptional regulator, iron-sulfur cluster assembly transcription factor
MKITAKLHYALVILIELALHQGEKGLKQKDLSARLNISLKFLDPILSALKISGVVYRVPGYKVGGYKLTCDPSEISVYKIYCSFEPELNLYHCLVDGVKCQRSTFCGSHYFLDKMNREMESCMLSTTLKDLADFQKQRTIV